MAVKIYNNGLAKLILFVYYFVCVAIILYICNKRVYRFLNLNPKLQSSIIIIIITNYSEKPSE